MTGSKGNVLLLVAVFLGGLIIGLFLSNYLYVPSAADTVVALTGKIVTENPNFYPDTRGWQGLFGYDNEPMPRDPRVKDGVVLLHPSDVDTPAYIFQEVMLESGKRYVLKARVGNAAKYYIPTGCDDSIVTIKLIDKDTATEKVIFDGVVNTDEEWKVISADVSDFAGRAVLLQAEGHAGGPCGEWAGEFSAVDYLYIEKA